MSIAAFWDEINRDRSILGQLEAEFLTAIESVRDVHLDRLRALGVTSAALTDICCRQLCLGVVSAEPVGGGLYQPGAGRLHIVQPIYSNGALVDLVAWRSDDPESPLLRTGAGWALGEDELTGRGGWESHATLHGSCLDWLRAGGTGSVILDWDAPEVRDMVELDHIAVADELLRTALLARIARPPRLPQIVVKEVRHAA